MRRLITESLCPNEPTPNNVKTKIDNIIADHEPSLEPKENDWEIIAIICKFWRPNFDKQIYP